MEKMMFDLRICFAYFGIQNPLPLVLQTGRNGKNDLFDLHLLCILLNLAGISHNRNTAKFGADLVGSVINDANRLVGCIV